VAWSINPLEVLDAVLNFPTLATRIRLTEISGDIEFATDATTSLSG
jgi:hypothetical protein